MPDSDEERQLKDLRGRMRKEFPDQPVDVIERAIQHGVDELRDAKIRNFVPILIERSVRRQIG